MADKTPSASIPYRDSELQKLQARIDEVERSRQATIAERDEARAARDSYYAEGQRLRRRNEELDHALGEARSIWRRGWARIAQMLVSVVAIGLVGLAFNAGVQSCRARSPTYRERSSARENALVYIRRLYPATHELFVTCPSAPADESGWWCAARVDGRMMELRCQDGCPGDESSRDAQASNHLACGEPTGACEQLGPLGWR